MSKLAQEVRKWVAVSKTSEQYRRIQYSLKLALRMLNGHFENLSIFQVNSSSLNFDQRFKDKTCLESWVKLDEQEKDQFDLHGGFQIQPDKPKMFKAGTIVEKPEDLQENVPYMFYLFKVVVGKSYCYKRKLGQEDKEIQLPPGYDSVNLEGESASSLFQNKYLIYNKDCALLTYVVNCKIKIDITSNSEQNFCSCGNPAIKYCENDAAFFCEECDILTHENHQKDNLSKILSSHNRVPIDNKPHDFGKCQDHPNKKNEYYCNCCQQPYCSECVLNGISRTESTKHTIVPIEQAYSNALNDAQNNDYLLEDKKKLILEQMSFIQEKIKQIKTNAEHIQTQISKMMQEAMMQLHYEVEKKSCIMKSDRVELERQYREIEYLSEFLKRQAEETNPVEFLQLFAGHNVLKNSVYKQRTTVSDIQVDMKLTGKPIITSEQTIKSVDIQHLNFEKQNIVDKAKTSIEKLHLAQRSTSFRTQLLNRGFGGMKDNGLFNTSQAFQEAQSKIPSMPRVFEGDEGPQKSNIANMLGSKMKQDITVKIEKALRAIEEKLEVPDNNIVEETIQRSMFGVFARNFKMFKETQPNDVDIVFRKYFKGSNILDDTSRIILYFNLPYNPIIKEKIEPVRIFPVNGQDGTTIQAMLEAFEDKQNVVRQANVIIMKVESEDKDINMMNEEGKDVGYIIGGYASHGWSASFNLRGDESCFLFNLTENLRFNAIKGQKHYQETDARDQNSRKIKFGDTDLVIEDDFQNVTSIMKNTHFAFGNELLQKKKIDSIIPGKKHFRPSGVEVWAFNLKYQQ